MRQRGRLPRGGKVRRVDQPLAGSDLEAAGPADHHQAARAGHAQSLDQAPGRADQVLLVVLAAAPRAGRGDDGVDALGQDGHCRRVGRVPLDDLNIQSVNRSAGPRDRDDGVPAPQQFRGDLLADGAGGAEYENLHARYPTTAGPAAARRPRHQTAAMMCRQVGLSPAGPKPSMGVTVVP